VASFVLPVLRGLRDCVPVLSVCVFAFRAGGGVCEGAGWLCVRGRDVDVLAFCAAQTVDKAKTKVIMRINL
jgi:hypothetical protein